MSRKNEKGLEKKPTVSEWRGSRRIGERDIKINIC